MLDVDLRALRGQERLDVLCGFLRWIRGATKGIPFSGSTSKPIASFSWLNRRSADR
ncbi:hypothetical protein [Streptomyces canus]|uniref:hypothetical protein n=1 Tax=Streptomyces canus TaxID=58343 RepID=UPI00343C805B